MQPSIVFLGTGQGADVVGKQLRTSGGIILKIGEHQLHIDPGPGSLHMAKSYYVNTRETTCVLVSHTHIHHCNDVNCVINAMTFGGLDKRGVLITNNMLVNGDCSTNPYLSNYHKSCLEKYIVLDAGHRAAIDEIEIHATTAKHSVEAIGFKIITPDFAVSYLGDTAYCPELLEEHKGSEILILNVVNPSGIKAEGNLNSDDAIRLLQKLRPQVAILTHFSMKMLGADPLVEARRIYSETGTQVIAASDGLIINPLTYAKKRSQKTLGVFQSLDQEQDKQPRDKQPRSAPNR